MVRNVRALDGGQRTHQLRAHGRDDAGGGIDFPNEDKARSNRRFEVMASAIGDPVTLRPEPRNRHDPHAVAVFSRRDVQLGYLSAERAPRIGARLRRGEEAVALYQGLRGSVAYIRVRFGGGAPTLPPERSDPPISPPDDGFYPDPDGPEWGA